MARFDRDKEKFNTGRLLEGVDSDETYSLEDILNEFGGWSRREQEPPAAESEPPAEESAAAQPAAVLEPSETEPAAEQTASETPPQEQPTAEESRAPSRFRFVNLDLSTPQEPELPPEMAGKDAPAVWSWTDRGEPAEPAAERETSGGTRDEPSGRETREQTKKSARRKKSQPEKRPPVPPASALRYYRSRSVFTRLRMLLVLLLTLAAMLLTAAPLIPVQFIQKLGSAESTPMVLLILMCVCAAASLDVMLLAVRRVLTFRFDLTVMLTVSFVICVIDSVGALRIGRVPYCAGVCLGFLFAAWSGYLSCVGSIRALRVVCEGDRHYSVKVARAVWNGEDCAFKAEEEVPDFVDLLEAPDRASTAMRFYVPLALIASVVVSAVSRMRADAPLIQMLAACLCAAAPVCGFICYTRPFALISTRLSRAGAALCGWGAARQLRGDLGVIVCGTDLYPSGTASISGVKVYNDFRLEQTLSYAATAISMSESNLKPLFDKLCEEEGVRLLEVGSFRTYEGGGVGAEIRGDIVLVGSLGFMHLMGIRLPQSTNIRQAVYVSVNGLIAGVIAVSYNPGTPVISALQTLLRRRGLNLVGATRDFLISPAMLHAKFRVPTTRAEFPLVSDRYRLSSLTAADAVDSAAVLSRSTMLPYAEAIAGARSLKSAVSTGLGVALFGGIFGLIVVFFLGLGGALETASALNLLLFSLIWAVPGLLVTTWSNKF